MFLQLFVKGFEFDSWQSQNKAASSHVPQRVITGCGGNEKFGRVFFCKI